MTRSKGAALAAGAGFALLVAPLTGGSRRSFVERHGSAIAVVMVVGVFAAILARGLLVPESWLGERSLLFRWHYLVGAARITGEQALTGVGPDGFQGAYMMARLPRSPEEVTSAHSMFVDWISMLGVSGLAWAALVGILLWRAGRHMNPADAAGVDAGTGYVGARTMLWVAAGAAVFAG